MCTSHPFRHTVHMSNATKTLITASLSRRMARLKKEGERGAFAAGLHSALATVNATKVPADPDPELVAAAERAAIIADLTTLLGREWRVGTRNPYDADAEENRHIGYENALEEAIDRIRSRETVSSVPV